MKIPMGLAILLVAGWGWAAQGQTIRAAPAPEWTALFDRHSGWTGADGIYSIPLSGRDSPGSAGGNQTAFVFSDTAVGEVNAAGQRQAGTTLVNNTLALLRGGTPDTNAITFLVSRDAAGKPRATFVPQTPHAQPKDWYWLGDGFAFRGTNYLFAYRMSDDPYQSGGVFDFTTAGVTLLTLPPGSWPPFANHRQTETPFFLPEQPGRGEVTFGAGILVNTAEAGAPHPDGFVYIYGVQNDTNKKLLAARVRPGSFTDFNAWKFWTGSQWASGVRSAAPITGRVSNELSVSPLGNGQYVLVFQQDAIGPAVAVRIGSSPVGPFGELIPVYTCPEPAQDPDTFVYNAKAHPHLSRPGELLVSYNVNTGDFFGDFFQNAALYRPRFIRLTLE